MALSSRAAAALAAVPSSNPSASKPPVSLHYLSLPSPSPHLRHFLSAQTPPRHIFCYSTTYGDESVRSTVAAYLTRTTHPTHPIAADNVVLLDSYTAALSILATLLCDRHQSCLLAAPFAPHIQSLLLLRAHVVCVPVDVRECEGHLLQPASITARFDDAIHAAATPVRFVVFSSPHLLTGRVHSSRFISHIIQWAAHRHLHVVFCESLALTTFPNATFTSALSVTPDPSPPPHVHVVVSLLDAFGLSNMSLATIVTYNHALLQRLKGNASYFSFPSRYNQCIAERLLSHPISHQILSENRHQLTASFAHAKQLLGRHAIEHTTPQPGSLIWLNLKRWCTDSEEGEKTLCQLLNNACVPVIAGYRFLISDFGMFLLSLQALSQDEISTIIKNLISALQTLEQR